MKKAKRRKAKASDITIDVNSHRLVPKMRVLSEKDKAHVLKQYGVTPEQLPKIYTWDPAIRTLEAKLGDILEIERSDLTGKYNFYRFVIE